MRNDHARVWLVSERHAERPPKAKRAERTKLRNDVFGHVSHDESCRGAGVKEVAAEGDRSATTVMRPPQAGQIGA